MNEIKEVKEKADKGELIQYIVIKIDDEQLHLQKQAHTMVQKIMMLIMQRQLLLMLKVIQYMTKS